MTVILVIHHLLEDPDSPAILKKAPLIGINGNLNLAPDSDYEWLSSADSVWALRHLNNVQVSAYFDQAHAQQVARFIARIHTFEVLSNTLEPIDIGFLVANFVLKVKFLVIFKNANPLLHRLEINTRPGCPMC